MEGAGGLGQLLAQQLLAAGECVLDIQPKLAARVRLLAAGNTGPGDRAGNRQTADLHAEPAETQLNMLRKASE